MISQSISCKLLLCLILAVFGSLTLADPSVPIQFPPTQGAVSATSTEIWGSDNSTFTDVGYSIYTPGFWQASFPQVGPATKRYKAIYTVHNDSWATLNNGGTVENNAVYTVWLNGTCTVSMNSFNQSDITVYTPFKYVGGAVPCDSVTGGVGTTCRVWTQNYTYAPLTPNPNWHGPLITFFTSYYFATDSDTMVGTQDGSYPGTTQRVDITNRMTQYTYLSTNQQARAQLPREAYTLPDACKALAPQGPGPISRVSAFDGSLPNGAASTSISVTLLLLLGVAANLYM